MFSWRTLQRAAASFSSPSALSWAEAHDSTLKRTPRKIDNLRAGREN
jgi:hypothetical protein